MRPLSQHIEAGRQIRTIGLDDGPFEREPGSRVPLCGVVCSGTRFEGMLWGWTTKDGDDATEVVAAMITESKFHAQLHLVLLDGVTVGGLNVIDLPALAAHLELPCAAVVRRPPNLDGIRRAVLTRPRGEDRWTSIQRAGQIHEQGGFVFQVAGAEPHDIATALGALTDRGAVPEPLRLAHLIASAVIRGESSRRA